MKVYVEDCYCDALGFKKDHAYEVLEERNGYYVLSIPGVPRDHRLSQFLIYKHWCHNATPVKEFEFPRGLFEL